MRSAFRLSLSGYSKLMAGNLFTEEFVIFASTNFPFLKNDDFFYVREKEAKIEAICKFFEIFILNNF